MVLMLTPKLRRETALMKADHTQVMLLLARSKCESARFSGATL